MKRSIVWAALSSCLLWTAGAWGYGITVDADPADWTMPAPPNVDTGHISRDAALTGAYVWADAAGDERTDFADPDGRVDITELQITSDATNLYVLVRMSDIDLETGDGAPQVQIAIDRDYVAGSGQTAFGMLSETSVVPMAAFEFLVVTRFGTDSLPRVYDPGWNDVSGGLASAAISAANDVIEIAVPWSVIGNAPTAPLHFSVMSCRGNAVDDEAWDVGGPNVSDALDVVSNYLDPGAVLNTWDEVGDNDVDYHFELWFHLDPDVEPSPPLVINEVLYEPPSGCDDAAGEWMEVFNRTGVDNLPVTGFVLTDRASFATGTEGAYAFPAAATITLDDVLLVARDADGYATAPCFAGHPAPDYDWNAGSATPDMVQQALWGGAELALANDGDELLLLDRYFTAIDVVTWEGNPYPGVTDAAADEGQSLERPQPQEDSNDCTVDMLVHEIADVTPGAVYWLSADGVSCVDDSECLSGLCVDDVCCDTGCGAGDLTDCIACSIAAGAAEDGICGSVTDGVACGDLECNECSSGSCIDTPNGNQGPGCTDATDNDCDNPDSCDGAGSCLANLESDGTGCGDGICSECSTGGCVDSASGQAGPGCDDATDDDCTAPDTCDGSGSCETNDEVDGISCGDDVCNECSVGVCVDSLVDQTGPGCDDATDTDCDNPDACDGAGTCLENFEADGTLCADGTCASGVCEAGGGGAGGEAGSGGTGGTGGEAGTGGTGGTGGSGGTATGGTGGTGATGGTGGSLPPTSSDPEDDSGCSCRLEATSTPSARYIWLGALGLMLIGLRRRGRRRPLV